MSVEYYVQAVRGPDGWVITEQTHDPNLSSPSKYREIATAEHLDNANLIASALNAFQE